MIKLPESRETKIQFLAARRFPEIYPWPNRRINPKLVSLSERESGARQYVEELQRKPDAELGRAYLAEKAKAAEEARVKAANEEAERTFNQPYARASVKHWAMMSFWTPDEAVALSLGVEPTVANWPAVKPLVGVSSFASRYASRREIVMRAKAMGQLWENTIPSNFLAWAARMGFAMPDDLVEAVQALGNQIADWKTLFDQQKELTEAAEKHAHEMHESQAQQASEHSAFIREMGSRHDELVAHYLSLLEQSRGKVEELEAQVAELNSTCSRTEATALGTRERDSLLKLLIGMAIRGYGYDPKAGRSGITKEIPNDLQLVGLSLDEDTVRKYLIEAKERLPGDETE